MPFSQADHRFMARALQLAEQGRYISIPNPNVGCVLVRDGVIIGEGYTQLDGTDHAEIAALKNCTSKGGRPNGATAYVTLEPCAHFGRTPPCAEALIKADIVRVVIAITDPFEHVSGRGIEMLVKAGIYVEAGLLAAEARQCLRGFLSRIERERPWVYSKIAASLDGRTALRSGESKWITGDAARRDVQRLRARAAAIVTGVGTIIADNPALTIREIDGNRWEFPRQPLRVVVDSSFRTPPNAKIFDQSGRTLVVGASEHTKRIVDLESAGAEVIILPGAQGRVDLQALMAELAHRRCGDVMVEAGATLNGELFSQRLTDELILYQAPVLLGNSPNGMAAFNLDSLQKKRAGRVTDQRMVGQDVRLTLLFD